MPYVPDDGDDGVIEVVDSDDDSDQVDREEAEGVHVSICFSLYDEYITFIGDALTKCPALSEVQYNGYCQVPLLPGHQVQREQMAMLYYQDKFFLHGLEDLVVPALRASLLKL